MTWIAAHCKPQKHQSKGQVAVGEDKLFKVSLPYARFQLSYQEGGTGQTFTNLTNVVLPEQLFDNNTS